MKLARDSFRMGMVSPSAAPTFSQLFEKNPDDLGEGDAGNGEVMAAQIGARVTDGRGHEGGDNPACHQTDPRAYMEGQEQKGGGVGPDPEKGRLSEREHARIAAHDVPRHSAHGEDAR